jgi:hypothetical protein
MSNGRYNLAPFTAALMLWSSTSLHSADPVGAASPAELSSRYSQALARKDAVAYALLVCWDRVLPQDRKSLESGLAAQAGHTATNFRFLTPEQMDQEIQKTGGKAPTRKPVTRGAVTFDFNLPVIGYLVYNTGDPDSGYGAVPVGLKGGRYFLITRAPVP